MKFTHITELLDVPEMDHITKRTTWDDLLIHLRTFYHRTMQAMLTFFYRFDFYDGTFHSILNTYANSHTWRQALIPVQVRDPVLKMGTIAIKERGSVPLCANCEYSLYNCSHWHKESLQIGIRAHIRLGVCNKHRLAFVRALNARRVGYSF